MESASTAGLDPSSQTPTPRFFRWDSGLPLRCDLLFRSLLPAGCEPSHMTYPQAYAGDVLAQGPPWLSN